MLLKCCTQYARKSGKLSRGHRTGKGQFSFQSLRQCQRMLKLLHKCTHLTHYITSKVMLKILQARLQQYLNRELAHVQAGFGKGRGTRDQTANIQHCWIIEKARVTEKHLLLLYWLRQSLWLCDHNKLWKIVQEMGLPDHLTCLLRILYAGQ